MEVSQGSMQGGKGVLKGRVCELLPTIFNPSSFTDWTSESLLL